MNENLFKYIIKQTAGRTFIAGETNQEADLLIN
jgi:hypothetical protein